MLIPVTPEPGLQVPARPSQTLTIAQLIINGLGIIFSLLSAALMVVIGLVDVFGQPAQTNGTTSVFAVAWIALMVAVLSAPSLVFAILRLANREVRRPRFPAFLLASSLLLIWPLALVTGNLLADKPSVSWIFFPPLQILAVGIPIWWLVEFARRKISIGSPQRSWGILSFSMLITTPVVIIVETLLLIVIGIIAVVWISGQPELLNELQQLANQVSSGQIDQQELMNLAQPYLQNPLAILTALALIAGIIPMIEELFKPLAVWLLFGRKLTPAQGLAAGAICGGSFALLETLLTLSGSIERGWAFLVAARTGTALLHITTAALLGSALVGAWQNRAYLRLALTYLAACALHGLWNALSVLSNLGILLQNPPAGMQFLPKLAGAMPYMLAVLVFFLFMLLWNTNRRVRLAEAAYITEQAAPAASSTFPSTFPTLPTENTGRTPDGPSESI